MEAKGWPMATIIRGRVVMRDGEIVAPHLGQPVRFQETLRVRRLPERRRLSEGTSKEARRGFAPAGLIRQRADERGQRKGPRSRRAAGRRFAAPRWRVAVLVGRVQAAPEARA